MGLTDQTVAASNASMQALRPGIETMSGGQLPAEAPLAPSLLQDGEAEEEGKGRERRAAFFETPLHFGKKMRIYKC